MLKLLSSPLVHISAIHGIIIKVTKAYNSEKVTSLYGHEIWQKSTSSCHYISSYFKGIQFCSYL